MSTPTSAAPGASHDGKSPAAGGHVVRGRVWLVEDSPLEAERARGILAPHYAVEPFVDAESMLERLAHGSPPDVVLLDWQLPGVSGIEACRFLRVQHDEAALPILMLTGRDARADLREGRTAGANDYLAKPYEDVELLSRVGTLVRVRRALADARSAQALAEAALSDVQEAHAVAAAARTRAESAALALREREERLRALLESTAEGLWGLDAEGRCTFANPAAVRLLGYDSADELLGRNLHALLHHTRADGSPYPEEECRMHAYRTGAEVAVDDELMWRKDGTSFHARYRASPLLHGDEVQGAVVAFEDITERRRAEEQLRKSADFEQKLIGIVSHDLRNPLSAILMGAQSLLRDDSLRDRQLRSAVRIQASAERALRMIRDLLDFTQARLSGGLPVRHQPLDLHALAQQVVDETQVSCPERTLAWVREGDGAMTGDPDRLAQVLSNLLSNALKYSPEDTPVRVTTRGEGAGVVLEVHNAGEPIPPELLPRLFQPMQRASALVDTQSRSVGLGLYIVDQVVRAHRGHVEVRSTAGEGTTFTVRLPR